jgi:hypothetical protein
LLLRKWPQAARGVGDPAARACTLMVMNNGLALTGRLRERPRLELLGYTKMIGHQHELALTVVKRGRRAAVVMHAGVALDVEAIRVAGGVGAESA